MQNQNFECFIMRWLLLSDHLDKLLIQWEVVKWSNISICFGLALGELRLELWFSIVEFHNSDIVIAGQQNFFLICKITTIMIGFWEFKNEVWFIDIISLLGFWETAITAISEQPTCTIISTKCCHQQHLLYHSNVTAATNLLVLLSQGLTTTTACYCCIFAAKNFHNQHDPGNSLSALY